MAKRIVDEQDREELSEDRAGTFCVWVSSSSFSSSLAWATIRSASQGKV